MCWFAGFHSLKCFNPPGLCVFLLFFFFAVFWTCAMPTLRSNFAIIHSMMNLPVNMFQFTSASCGGVTRDPNKLDAHPRSAMRVMKSAINRLLSSYTDVSGDMTDKQRGWSSAECVDCKTEQGFGETFAPVKARKKKIYSCRDSEEMNLFHRWQLRICIEQNNVRVTTSTVECRAGWFLSHPG